MAAAVRGPPPRHGRCATEGGRREEGREEGRPCEPEAEAGRARGGGRREGGVPELEGGGRGLPPPCGEVAGRRGRAEREERLR